MVTCRRLEVLSFSVIANVLTLWLLSLLPASANSAESVVFPVVSGDVSVKEKYGAKDAGKTDDTAAFQMAMADGDGGWSAESVSAGCEVSAVGLDRRGRQVVSVAG